MEVVRSGLDQCNLIALSCWIPNTGFGAARQGYALLCLDLNRVPRNPSEHETACADACVEAQDSEGWWAYIYHCRIANPYNAQARSDTIDALDDTGCEVCCALVPPAPVVPPEQ